MFFAGRRCVGCRPVGLRPLVVGGAVVGTMMAVDRRTTGTQVEDEGIELRSANRLSELLGDRGHVNVTSFNRQVLLTGRSAQRSRPPTGRASGAGG